MLYLQGQVKRTRASSWCTCSVRSTASWRRRARARRPCCTVDPPTSPSTSSPVSLHLLCSSYIMTCRWTSKQLYYLCADKFAFLIVIYIKHCINITLNRWQFNKIWSENKVILLTTINKLKAETSSCVYAVCGSVVRASERKARHNTNVTLILQPLFVVVVVFSSFFRSTFSANSIAVLYSPSVQSLASTSVRALKIASSGSHTTFGTHKNTAHTGRKCWHCFCGWWCLTKVR